MGEEGMSLAEEEPPSTATSTAGDLLEPPPANPLVELAEQRQGLIEQAALSHKLQRLLRKRLTTAQQQSIAKLATSLSLGDCHDSDEARALRQFVNTLARQQHAETDGEALSESSTPHNPTTSSSSSCMSSSSSSPSTSTAAMAHAPLDKQLCGERDGAEQSVASSAFPLSSHNRTFNVPPNTVLETKRQLAQYRLLARNLLPNNSSLPPTEHHVQQATDTWDHAYTVEYHTRRRYKEFYLASRKSYRINELQNIPTFISPALKTKALIELHGLRLHALQTEVRQHVWSGAQEFTNDRASYRRNALRKPKLISIRDPELTLQKEREEQERQRQREAEKKHAFIQAVLAHAEQFKHFHVQVRKKIKKQARGVVNHFAKKQKEAEAERERLEKERIKLLMAQDTEAYKKLLDTTRDSRKTFLLDKIEEHLNVIGSKIRTHQRAELAEEKLQKKAAKDVGIDGADAVGDTSGGDGTALAQDAGDSVTDAPGRTSGSSKDVDVGEDDEDDEDDDDVEEDEDAANGGIVGFDAHRKKEQISAQPDMLVGGTLKPYQVTGLEWMVSLYNNKLNGILADEMGLGKTIQTIALFSHLAEKKNNWGPFLVIVPLATISNWVNEFEKWAPAFDVLVLRGDKKKRRGIVARMKELRFNVLLTTYELTIIEKAALGKIQWRHLIIDEGHRLKNPKNKLSQVLMEYFRSPRRLLLTGTPLQNNLPELWALLNFLLPDVFNSAETFDSWFNAPFAGTSENVHLDEEEKHIIILQLHKILRPILLRRLKKEVLAQLPDKTEYVLKCEMSALQRKAYTMIQKYNVALPTSPNADKEAKQSQSRDRAGAKSLQNTIMHLRKLCCHPFLFEPLETAYLSHMAELLGTTTESLLNGPELWRSCGKLELLDRILLKLRETKHRFLIFSQFKIMLDILEDYLFSKGIKYLRMDGETSADERGPMLDAFNAEDSEYEVFLLSTRAGGLGLNLQTADTVIIYDSDWNPHQDLQAQARAHRIGQENEVRVFRLVTLNSVEEHILERARFKLEVDDKIIQAGKFNRQSTEGDSREYLLSILEEVDDTNTEGDTITNDELNQMLARGDHELEIFEDMDERQDQYDASWKNSVRKTRVVQANELPDIITNAEAHMQEKIRKEEEAPKELERKDRKRTNVSYNEDLLTETEYLMAIEEGNLEEAIERKLEQARRRESAKAARKAKRASTSKKGGKRGSARAAGKGAERADSDDDEEEDEEGAEGAASSNPLKRAKRSGTQQRGKKAIVEVQTSSAREGKKKESSTADSPLRQGLTHSRRKKRGGSSADNDMEEDEFETAFDMQTEGDGDSSLTAEQREELTRMEKVFQDLCALVDSNGVSVGTTLWELPSEEDLPEYYETTAEPIDLSDIQRKLFDRRYTGGLSELASDVERLVNNTHLFYDDSDTEFLHASLIQERSELYAIVQEQKNLASPRKHGGRASSPAKGKPQRTQTKQRKQRNQKAKARAEAVHLEGEDEEDEDEDDEEAVSSALDSEEDDDDDDDDA